MHTKIISGTYSAGYLLHAGYDKVSITSTGSIGGTGLFVDIKARVTNGGRVVATTYGADGDGDAAINLAFGGNVANSGTLSGGLGEIGASGGGIGGFGGVGGGGGSGVYLAAIGSVTNRGTITGGLAGVGGNDYMAFGNGGQGGFGGDGVLLRAAGLVTNHGTIAGGQGGVGGHGDYFGGTGGVGGISVQVHASGSTVVNSGLIAGGQAGRGGPIGLTGPRAGYGGNGGQGVFSSYTGTIIDNTGTIIGGNAGEGGGVGAHGGFGGVGVYLREGGTLTNGGLIEGGASGGPGYLEAGGVYAQGLEATTVINSGTIKGGNISVFLYSSDDVLIAEAGAQFIGAIQGNGATIEVNGGKGAISSLGSGGQLSGSDSGTFNSFGTYVIGATGNWTLAGAGNLAAFQSLTVAGELSIGGALDETVNASLSIDAGGVLDFAGASTGTLTGAVTNDGVLSTQGAVVTVSGAVAGIGAASIGGGSLSFGSTFNQDIVFTGTTGELELAHSRSFTATVSGFLANGEDRLDLDDIKYSGKDEATFTGSASGGVLTVGRGTDEARINLTGDYLGDTFITARDGHGGVLVTASPTAQTSGAPHHAFISAMAGMDWGNAAMVVHAVGAGRTTQLLLATPMALAT